MQEQTHQHQVAVQSRIQRQHHVREQHELQRVLKQSTDIRVMHADRGGRAAELLHDVFICQILFGQRAHARMLQ